MARKHRYAVPNSSIASFPVGVKLEMIGYGWVYLHISLGEKTAEIHLSDVFDPFPELLDWLQAVATGDFPAEFDINEEGTFKTLVVHAFERDRLLFAVLGTFSETELVAGVVDRNALVAEFRRELNGFFRNREQFIPSEWVITREEEKQEDENHLYLDRILGHPFLSKPYGAGNVK